MPIQRRVLWGSANPLSDPRLARLADILKALRTNSTLPEGVTCGGEFKDVEHQLPPRPPRHWKEYYVTPKVAGVARDKLRLVIGTGGEVFLTGDHYDDFRQILHIPG
jgi:hypothetical protein